MGVINPVISNTSNQVVGPVIEPDPIACQRAINLFRDQCNGNTASFKRASTATYYNNDAHWTAPVDALRVSDGAAILEGAATNKVTCAKSNPQNLTNISKSGDAAAALSVVNDAGALAAAGLSSFGPNVYKFDNSTGSTGAYIELIGATGNANPHSYSVYLRCTGTVKLGDGQTGTFQTVTNQADYVRYKKEGYVGNSSSDLGIYLNPGSVVWFILPQLEEGPVCTSPIPGGTGAITRASEGADTSGNGLSIALNRQMLDSLTGEVSDWTAAWTTVSGAPTYSGGNKVLTYSALTATDYHALLAAGVSVGHTVEIGYTISGYSAGSFNFGFGSGQAGTTRTANGTYTERGTLTTDTNLYAYSTSLTGVVTINYVRRVLESGQTNPGEGTIVQWVSLPWGSTSGVVQAGVYPNILAFTNNGQAPLCFTQGGGQYTIKLSLWDGVTIRSVDGPNSPTPVFAAVMQYSAALGKMRVGIYSPTTGTLTWSSPTLAGATPYRGFFPIHASNRLRWFYGGGNFPISIISLSWFNLVASDTDIIYAAKEALA